MHLQNLVNVDGKPKMGAPLSLLLGAQAARAPQAIALSLADRVVTRAELERKTNQRARQLTAAGVQTDGVVLIALPNGQEFYELAIAAWKAGATPLHVSHKLTEREFGEIVSLSQPDCIVDVASPLRSPVDGWDDSALAPAVAKCWKISTSGGSTGRPKLIVDPNPAVWSDDKVALRRGADPIIVNPAPLYHNASFTMMIPALLEGGHVIEMGRFDPERYLELASRHGATWAYLVPAMMSRISKLPQDVIARFDLSSIETLMHTAAACPPVVKQFWIDWLGPEVIWEFYGGSERIGSCLIGGQEWLEHVGSVGRPRSGVSVRILDGHGDEVPTGVVGEIYFKKVGGIEASFRYVGAEIRQQGDWATFGDLGWVDDQGYLYLADRRTDMIVTGGINVYPAEIEGQIDALPGVLCSVVVGAPDEDLGEVVCAFVQLNRSEPSVGQDRLLSMLASKLSREKLPKLIRFVTEDVRDEAGKVRRSAWRERIRRELGKVSGKS